MTANIWQKKIYTTQENQKFVRSTKTKDTDNIWGRIMNRQIKKLTKITKHQYAI